MGDWTLNDEDFLASFVLPGPADRHDALATLHPMPRESRVRFDEKSHTYRVDGIIVPRSVTGLLHQYVSEFNLQAAIESMKSGTRWEERRGEFEVDGVLLADAEIAARWTRNGEIARARGTLAHFHIESFLSGRCVLDPSPEFQSFLQIYHGAIQGKMEVFRVEVNVFHCGLRAAALALRCAGGRSSMYFSPSLSLSPL